jgi:restriction system protein
MARRKKASTADDMLELVAMLPWWAGVLLAVGSYFVLHSIASQPVVAPTQPGQMGAMVTQSIWKSLATTGQYLLPFICLLGAVTSA